VTRGGGEAAIAVPPLYAIADSERLGGAGAVVRAVASMSDAGIRWIQVRAKGLGGGETLEVVAACLRALEGSGASLWVNDRVDVAALLPVAGVHLGRLDLPPSAARAVIPPGRWIGASTHDLSQVAEAGADPAVDVVAFGPVFATGSKRDPDPVVGLDGLRAARRLTDKPLLAIGGIDAARLAAIYEAGADAAVVLSAVSHDVGASCRSLLAAAASRAPTMNPKRDGALPSVRR
jgi:thiamine-phosphate pyrophosphorylase